MKKKAKNKSADLRKQIGGHIKDLARLTDDAARSEAVKSFLDTCARFYQYSLNNQALIAYFCPHATQVAGFKKWNEFNRYVRKGEHGIPILAPCVYKVDPDQDDSPKKVTGFRVVYVFDVSQTDGEDLPELPNWKSPARLLELENRLIEFAISKDITVDRKELQGETQGSSRGGEIELAEHAGTKTLIHEIAHELLHQKSLSVLLNRGTKELEAEAVAYVVSSHFGIPDLASPNYLALFEADAEKILKRYDRISTCAAELIQAIEPPQ